MGRLYGPFEKSSSRRNLLGKRKKLDSVEKTLEKDFQCREVTHQLLVRACFDPSNDNETMLRALVSLVNESPRLCNSLACATFLATAVTLMLVGEGPVKIAIAHVLHALADAHYACKVLIGELGGFHALAEMI